MLLRVVVGFLLFNLFSLRAEQKPVSTVWREKVGDLVVLHFSAQFPRLGRLDSHIFRLVLLHKAKVVAVRLKQSERETQVSFLCPDTKHPSVNRVIKEIKRAVKEHVTIEEILPPSHIKIPPPAPPARVTLAPVFLL